MDVIMEARDLHYAYPGGVMGLRGLSLALTRGRRLAILGPNGAGKTTLLLHLNGTLRPGKGAVLLDGQVQSHGRAALEAWRRRIGLVLQDPDDQLFAATVYEDVSFGPLNLGLAESEVRHRVEQALRALDIVELAGRPTHMLSFGQKKRAAIAGAMALRPDILLLDEPTAGLDSKGSAHLLAALDLLRAQGTTLAFTTHDVDFAWAWADDIALFDSGTVISQGPAERILTDRATLALAGLHPPFLLEFGLKARESGLLPRSAPLPRTYEAGLYALQEISSNRHMIG